MRYLRLLSDAVVAGLFSVFSGLMLLAGFVVLAIAAYILLAALLVALVGGVRCLPYIIGRFQASSPGLGRLWTDLQRLAASQRSTSDVGVAGVVAEDRLPGQRVGTRITGSQGVDAQTAEPRGRDAGVSTNPRRVM